MPTENQRTVLGELLNLASPLAKKVISAYSPDVKYELNMANVRRFDASHIEAAALFLGFKVRAQEKKLYKNLKVLSDRVILKIESLFESSCTECGEKYCNKLSDSPLMTCYLCLQGCHNCDKVSEKAPARTKSPGGTVWLCSGCLKKNDLVLFPSPKTIPSKSSESEDQNEKTDENEDEEEGERESPRRNREPAQKTGPVCEAYKRRECPHGLTGKRLVGGIACPYRHPPRCFRWCKHGENKQLGCTRGKECRYFHPKLCQSSVSKRVCLNVDCKYVHLKNTRRSKNVANTKEHSQRVHKVSESESVMKRGYSLNSISTCQDSPSRYPPTIHRKELTKAENKQKSNDSDQNSFLVRYMENMKQGIQDQIAEMRTEVLATLPQLVNDQLTRQAALQPQQLFPMQFPLSQQPPNNQNLLQFPTNRLQFANFQPQFPGSSL